MAGIREQKKSETKRAILAAAVKLFAEKSFDKTSIEDIAKEAGIGKTTIYGYYNKKNEIFHDFCDEELDLAFSKLKPSDCDDRPLTEKLIDFFMIQFVFVTKNREFGRQMSREMVFPCEINDKAKIHDQRYFDILENYIAAAQNRGEVSTKHDHFNMSVHFFSLYLGLLAGWYTGYLESLSQVEETMRTLFTQVLKGIEK